MRLSDMRDAAPRFTPSPADRVLGLLGAAVIGLTLFGVRIWSRVTRTPYYRD